ncbi:MAG: hypothetical protein Q4A88_01875, partial [Clostridia bacterium]|nr:hypothetical protein [Clostridia bacterium]
HSLCDPSYPPPSIAICFIIVPLLTRVVNYPTFKGKEALPDEVPPSPFPSHNSLFYLKFRLAE